MTAEQEAGPLGYGIAFLFEFCGFVLVWRAPHTVLGGVMLVLGVVLVWSASVYIIANVRKSDDYAEFEASVDELRDTVRQMIDTGGERR